ncbi:hypothetical protein WJX84_007139, partial [Apatococcus fuscideae]
VEKAQRRAADERQARQDERTTEMQQLKAKRSVPGIRLVDD